VAAAVATARPAGTRVGIRRSGALERARARRAARSTASTGLVSRLWPTNKPVYKRPGAIIGGVALAGLLGWLWYARSKKTTSTAITPVA